MQLAVQTHIGHQELFQTTTTPVVLSTNCHGGTSIWGRLLRGPWLCLRFGHIARKEKNILESWCCWNISAETWLSWASYEKATPTSLFVHIFVFTARPLHQHRHQCFCAYEKQLCINSNIEEWLRRCNILCLWVLLVRLYKLMRYTFPRKNRTIDIFCWLLCWF